VSGKAEFQGNHCAFVFLKPDTRNLQSNIKVLPIGLKEILTLGFCSEL
jgi:hypothetical protein